MSGGYIVMESSCFEGLENTRLLVVASMKGIYKKYGKVILGSYRGYDALLKAENGEYVAIIHKWCKDIKEAYEYARYFNDTRIFGNPIFDDLE